MDWKTPLPRGGRYSIGLGRCLRGIYYLLGIVILLGCIFPQSVCATTLSYAISTGRPPRYKADYTSFDYVNPDAPKGGEIRYQTAAQFNSFNPFILKGSLPAGKDLLYDSLMVTPEDDPFTQYGLVAESVEIPHDRSWIIFHLDSRARFHDGVPIRAHDVVFTYQAMNENLGNAFRRFLQHVDSVHALDAKRVQFNFKSNAPQELASFIGLMPIYPAHYWKKQDIKRTTMLPPLGSGPYRIKSFKSGGDIVYERVADYWAKEHPARRGQFNFDIVRYSYYRDSTVALEAFKAGLYDVREEAFSKRWATAYTGPLFDSGKIRCRNVQHTEPLGIQGFFFNTRRDVFKDQRVRKALLLAFDYSWVNQKLFFGQLPRNTSYFSNSDLEARGVPTGRELALLEPFRDSLPPRLFTQEYSFPVSSGDGYNRDNTIRAMRLLEEAGYVMDGGVLVHRKTKAPLRFQLVAESAATRRICLCFRAALQRLGVDMQILMVDPPQFIHRLKSFDFDMIASAYQQQIIPGQEQMFNWHSSAMEVGAGKNLIGLARPEVDALTWALANAKNYEETVAAGRALDRVLLWGEYAIPLGSVPFYRLAWWNRFGIPAVWPTYGLAIEAWWEKTPLEHPTTQKESEDATILP